jgi:hypothetical protein
MPEEIHFLKPQALKQFFGKLQILNDTPRPLKVTLQQVETKEGFKFCITLADQKEEEITTEAIRGDP